MVFTCGAYNLNGNRLMRPAFENTLELRKMLCFSNPIAHPTVMFDMHNCPSFKYKDVKCEDYELWCYLASEGVNFSATKKAFDKLLSVRKYKNHN